MTDIFTNVTAAIIFSLMSAFVVAIIELVRRWRSRERLILPGRVKIKANKAKNFTHLNGLWEQYYLTFCGPIDSQPIWLHGIQKIQILRNHFVRGTTELADHPTNELDYLLHGEIRGGRLILTDSCLQNETEFASIIFPDLRSDKLLVGIWSGFDNNLRLIGAPVIWSRTELSASELNEYARNAPMYLVALGPEYVLYIPPIRHAEEIVEDTPTITTAPNKWPPYRRS